jgi:ubiquinone/menaquinone biosynthesis C-methylase UbiE
MISDVLNETYDFSDARLVSNLDEFSLWSAPFGLKLLECVKMKKGMNVLDIGFGTGFPLLELSQRLGQSSNVFGIDPWDAAIVRVNQKISFFGLTNTQIQHAVAEEIPFPDQFFDLIVSNNGLNNVEDLDKSLSECHRISRPDAQMVITMNLPETFTEFYTIFRQTLSELGLEKHHKDVDNHIFHKRKPLDYLKNTIENHGFSLNQMHIDSFKYHFTDGTALLNYSFFKIAFLDGWKSCIEAGLLPIVFELLEKKLNAIASKSNSIELTVPFVCFDLTRNK